jgi:uncharacterized iron-regulated membrane protein
MWGGQKRHTFRIEAESGREVEFEIFQDQSAGRRLRTFFRFAHTGEYFGMVGQSIAGLAPLLATILVWSGFALAWRRLARPFLARSSTQ